MMAENRSVPIRIKRQVFVEAGHRCAIPTCRNSANLELHHIEPYSKVKSHRASNLIVLCPNCHALASSGKIDKQEMFMYKDNLRYAIDRYSRFEVDILIDLSRDLKGYTAIPPYLDILVKRMIGDGLIELVETPETFSVTYRTSIGDIKLKQNADLLVITQKGREYVEQLSNERVGYDKD